MQRFSIHDELTRRILVLDGAMGTMLQHHATADDLAGGPADALVLTRPDIIAGIHEAYLAAGADIVSTDSFNANAISMADYGLQDKVYEMNRAAAAIARAAADKFTMRNPSKPRFVAGSMGPTNRTAALSANVDDPAARDVTFAQLADAYYDQARGLVDGGADVLLVETVFDTLNAKAALFAIDRLRRERGGHGGHGAHPIPVMVSGTIADISGRTLSGQTIEAFYTSMAHGDLLSIGLNCAFGARQMRPYLERLAAVAGCRISTHPNAGLPNLAGGYDETPAMFAADMEEYLKKRLLNIVGGCCGTTPEHIRSVARIAARYAPRPLPTPRHTTVLAGLEPLAITPETGFINIGERANVAGSARFARLVREGKFDEAVAVARDQMTAGAQIVDVCMDDGMIDGASAMTRFLNMAAAEPELARVPLMIDSSSWEVLRAGLQCVQGKSIVNSISLKEGEAEFLRRARLIQSYGAAAVVMLFDERGQADTFARKTEVAGMAYKLLTESGFPPENIIFDPNVLAIATGIPEHDNYAVDFIEATRWIKANLPHAKVSAGVSNLSFSFRGNDRVRGAMHSVFLYHAIAAGLDMGIVNAAAIPIYSDIEPQLLELAEDVVLNRRADATERLAAYAEGLKAAGGQAGAGTDTAAGHAAQKESWRELPVSERIAHAVLKGTDDHIAADALEAYREAGSPIAVIDTMLMPAMGEVGELFGAGKMFLPQVVRSARVMRRAVDALTPYLPHSETSGASGTDTTAKSTGRVLMATVRGDVHDIGKNIVSVVAQCNGYDIIDLGVMVEAEKIADEAERNHVDAIGLSGLITPSLDEMIRVVRELERRGLRIPVLIGGATTSRLHTAVKIAPEYSGPVIHSRNASDGARILARLSGADSQTFVAETRAQQQADRERHAANTAALETIPPEQARANGYKKPAGNVVVPQHTGRIVFSGHPIAGVEPLIDWKFFFAAWGVKRDSEEGQKLWDDAQKMLARIKTEKALRLEGVAGVFPARREGDDIMISVTREGAAGIPGNVTGTSGKDIRLPQQRNLAAGKSVNLSVADYITNDTQDYVGAFALTAGVGLKEFTERLRAERGKGGEGDDYGAMLAKLLADRLTEAFAEAVHDFIRRVAWGFEAPGLRYAFGYPATPDHSLKAQVFELLGAQRTTSMRLTDNHMIEPGEALCGLIVADPEARYFAV